MKTLDEIKKMIAAGDTAEADAALKELLAKEPDNLQAKMLYGTCRQLLGDEETFKRIHDELATKMEDMRGDERDEEWKLWNKYYELFMRLNRNALCNGKEKKGPISMEYVVIGVVITSAVLAGVVYYGKRIQEQMSAMCLYMGQRYAPVTIQTQTEIKGENPDAVMNVNKKFSDTE